jgi:uncharacterized protein (TIGR04255 family)
MAVKYSKAPISELTCGVFFKQNSLLNNAVIFKIIAKLSKDYPTINTHPTGAEEDVVNNTIQVSMDYARSGFATYRLQSPDFKWQVVITQNMLTFHWVRQDTEDVGNYPGFSEIYSKFYTIYQTLKELFEESIFSFNDSVKCYYLGYLDRINFDDYKSKGMELSDIISLPSFSFYKNQTKYTATNYMNKYSVSCDDINGSSIITISTPTFMPFGQIIMVDNKIKGIGSDIKKWFKDAHDIQVAFFEKIFTEKILNSWK